MNRISFALLSLLALTAPVPAIAQGPPEVAGLRFDPDGITLRWNEAAGAEAYNVYRGSAADGSDLDCLAPGIPDLELTDTDAPGLLFTYVVASWSVEGQSTLGRATGGEERLPLSRCVVDPDGDGVSEELDNCPGLANPSQLDQNADGLGDPCDPYTYDFETDVVGQRPADTTPDGGVNETFAVRAVAGEQGASYDGDALGQHDLFDRLLLPAPQRELDVYLDLEDVAEVATIELWSEAATSENAGGGVYVRVGPDGTVLARIRRGNSTTTFGEHLPSSADRLRLRLRKQEDVRSTLALDEWDGAGWQEVNEFEIPDDSLLFGRNLATVAHDAGRRAILRMTADALAPAEAFTLDLTFDQLAPWKLYQRGPDDHAPVPLPFTYRSSESVRVEARVVEHSSGLPLPGHGFADHSWELPAAPEGRSERFTLDQVPAGGNYDLEARLVAVSDGSLLGEDTVSEIAVGDVFLAAGQSNMSGYSGGLDPAEAPVPEVHLFGNDYVWKQASEPMDAGTDQVDRVSEESPLHSLMLRFAKEVSAGAAVPVAVIPAPLGGTNLHTQWQRRPDDPTNRGTLYGSAVHRVLAQGYSWPIRGALWYQGESDVGRGVGPYLQDLENLVADFRADLGSPSLFFGNCQLATYDFADLFTWIEIQEAQRQQSEADSLSDLVALVDQPRSDAIHLNVPGYKEAGRRLALAVLEGSYGLPQALGPRIVAVRRHEGRRNRVEVLYDKDVSGGSAGLYRVQDSRGPVTVTGLTVSGPSVVLQLQNPASGATVVSYGFGTSPAAGWLVAADGSGAALAFHELPVEGSDP